jgi:hypothetical protein
LSVACSNRRRAAPRRDVPSFHGDEPTDNSVEEGLALQSALPRHGEQRQFAGLLEKQESAGDWISAGEVTDVGPVGWLVGTLAGLIGWTGFKRRRTKLK